MDEVDTPSQTTKELIKSRSNVRIGKHRQFQRLTIEVPRWRRLEERRLRDAFLVKGSDPRACVSIKGIVRSSPNDCPE